MRITKYRLDLARCRHVLFEESSVEYDGWHCEGPHSIVEMVNNLYQLNKRAEELFYLVALDVRVSVSGVFELSHGTCCNAILDMKAVFSRLLLVNSSSFVLIHNHPSGDPSPSKEDISSFDRAIECSGVMGMSGMDYIIVGGGNKYYSFFEQGHYNKQR